MHGIEFGTYGFVRPKTATWFEEALGGRHYHATFRFFDMPHSALLLSLTYRDRVIPLGEGSGEINVNFSDASNLRVETIFPPAVRIGPSEAIENAAVMAVPIETLSVLQVIDVQFTYFSLPTAMLTVIGFFIFSHLASSALGAAIKASGKLVRRHLRHAARPRDSASTESS